MEQVSSLKTAVKYKDTPIGKIPVDWSIKNIGEVCEILDNKRIPLNKEQREKMKGDIPYYGANGVVDYINDHIFEDDLILMAEDGGYFDEYMDRPIAYLVHGKSWVNNHAHVLKTIRPNDTSWVYYSLVHKNVIPFIKGGTRSKLNQTDLRQIPIPIPPIPEQESIAEILTTVDDAIEKTTQIIEKTKEVKKGLMQRLLTRGIGHKKFKKTEIGEIPEEWEVAHLGDIAKIERGRFSHRPRNAPQFYGGDIPFVQTADIVNSNGRVRNHSQTLNEFGLSISKVFPKGTILITIAANIGYTGILEFDSACPDSLIAITPNEDISATYLHYYLSGERKKMDAAAPQCAQKNINIQILKSWNILLPPMEEQKKIGNILLTGDNEIEKESSHKEELETLKKGLMQVLLTGKIRVAV